jgi:hypothetical protein
MTKLVRYVCRAADHQEPSLFDPRAPWSPNPLRLREGAWAYCPMGAQDGHQWEQIADRPIADLRGDAERVIADASAAGS